MPNDEAPIEDVLQELVAKLGPVGDVLRSDPGLVRRLNDLGEALAAVAGSASQLSAATQRRIRRTAADLNEAWLATLSDYPDGQRLRALARGNATILNDELRSLK